jgi:hypothetical protein
MTTEFTNQTPQQREAWGGAHAVMFAHQLADLKRTYAREVDRLVVEYRERILAGEFSGNEPDGPRYIRLEYDLARRHPWLRTVEGALSVIAVSRWSKVTSSSNCIEFSTARIIKLSASECLAHDVLALAAQRGWVGPLRDSRPYTVRRAAIGATSARRAA